MNRSQTQRREVSGHRGQRDVEEEARSVLDTLLSHLTALDAYQRKGSWAFGRREPGVMAKMRRHGSVELDEVHEAIAPGSYFRQEKRCSIAMEQKKISSRVAVAASVVILATGLAMSSVSTASATTDTRTASTPTPTVSFSFAQQTVDSGAHAKLIYSGRNLPERSEIFLQLAYGTPTEWYFAEPLRGTAGTATLPGLPAGMYEFRLVAEHGISEVAISWARFLSVIPARGCGLICTILEGVGDVILAWLLSLF